MNCCQSSLMRAFLSSKYINDNINVDLWPVWPSRFPMKINRPGGGKKHRRLGRIGLKTSIQADANVFVLKPESLIIHIITPAAPSNHRRRLSWCVRQRWSMWDHPLVVRWRILWEGWSKVSSPPHLFQPDTVIWLWAGRGGARKERLLMGVDNTCRRNKARDKSDRGGLDPAMGALSSRPNGFSLVVCVWSGWMVEGLVGFFTWWCSSLRLKPLLSIRLHLTPYLMAPSSTLLHWEDHRRGYVKTMIRGGNKCHFLSINVGFCSDPDKSTYRDSGLDLSLFTWTSSLFFFPPLGRQLWNTCCNVSFQTHQGETRNTCFLPFDIGVTSRAHAGKRGGHVLHACYMQINRLLFRKYFRGNAI